MDKVYDDDSFQELVEDFIGKNFKNSDEVLVAYINHDDENKTVNSIIAASVEDSRTMIYICRDIINAVSKVDKIPPTVLLDHIKRLITMNVEIRKYEFENTPINELIPDGGDGEGPIYLD